LLVIVVLGDDLHTFRDEVSPVETAETSTNWPIMLISAPDERASINAFVPDLAIVPR